jgi:hypothetical protein
MENNTTPIESLFEKVEDYGKTTLTLLKLNAVDKSADVFSFLAIKMVLFLFVVLFLFTLSIGISLWLGELLGKSYYGFFVTTGSYFLIGLFIQIFKTSLIGATVRKAVISEMLKKDDDEEETR